MRAALLILASSTLAAGVLLIAATQSPADHIEGTSCGTSSECSGHQYWPRMTLDDLQKCNDLAGCRFVGQDDADELLGYHGSDDVRGGGGSDVLWGDWKGGADPFKT